MTETKNTPTPLSARLNKHALLLLSQVEDGLRLKIDMKLAQALGAWGDEVAALESSLAAALSDAPTTARDLEAENKRLREALETLTDELDEPCRCDEIGNRRSGLLRCRYHDAIGAARAALSAPPVGGEGKLSREDHIRAAVKAERARCIEAVEDAEASLEDEIGSAIAEVGDALGAALRVVAGVVDSIKARSETDYDPASPEFIADEPASPPSLAPPPLAATAARSDLFPAGSTVEQTRFGVRVNIPATPESAASSGGETAFPRCHVTDCQNEAACFGMYDTAERGEFTCDEHCGHGCEDGRCVPVAIACEATSGCLECDRPLGHSGQHRERNPGGGPSDVFWDDGEEEARETATVKP